MNINDDDSNDLLLSDEDNLLDESSLENNSLLSENKVDGTAEANASLSTMDSDPFNLIKDVNSTLSKIEKKIDKDSAQLSKLDQLEEIKDELKKITKSDKINQFNDVIDNDTNSPTDGDNLPGNTDLIIQIENLQEKIQKIEASNNTYEEKLKDIEETLDRFKKIENELEVEVIEEEIGKNELNEKDIFNNKIDDMKNNEDDNYKVKIHTKQKSNVLVLLLLAELLIKIESLQNKIRELENENKERFEKIESTVERFEEIEKELEIEYTTEEDEKEQTQEQDLEINQISPAQNTSNEEDSNFKETSKPKSNLLLLLLIFLIILVSGAFILDTLGIVNLYLTQTLKTLF